MYITIWHQKGGDIDVFVEKQILVWQNCSFGDPLPRLFKPSFVKKKKTKKKTTKKKNCRQGQGLFSLYIYIENF